MSFARQKNKKIPKISLLVVINGPVAMAGSIPLLFKIMGTNVPINAATIMTQSIEIAMVKLKFISQFIISPKIIILSAGELSKKKSMHPIKLIVNRFNQASSLRLFYVFNRLKTKRPKKYRVCPLLKRPFRDRSLVSLLQ